MVAQDVSIKKESRSIVYYAIGKVGMWIFLEATLVWWKEQIPKDEFQEAVKWIRGKISQTLCEVQFNIKNFTGVEENLEKVIEKYNHSIGTIEESMPYRGGNLDDLLRDLKSHNADKASADLDMTIIDLFEKNVLKNENADAIIYPGGIVSYKELDVDVDVVCQLLKSKGLDQGDVIAVIMDRSPMLAVGLLAILKSGSTILMLNANDPIERNQLIMRKARVKFAISVECLRYLPYDEQINVIYIDEIINCN